MSKNPAFMTKEERREEFGESCSFCGYREAHHPVEASHRDGILCEVAE